jgi:CHAT domain-containing protein
MVAAAVGAPSLVAGAGTGVAANRPALWAAQGAELLHVAGEVVARARWRVLRLSDGDVEPAEIVRRGLAPRIAVLSSNSSATALDEEGWGSLASALLEAGTDVVIATEGGVDNSGVLSVIAGLYGQAAWRTDPAGALARVQSALDAQERRSESRSESTARTWAAFGVLRRPPFVAPRAQPSATPR